MTSKIADLHMHSTASDGTDTVEKVTKVAKERGYDCIAITDHDTLHTENKERVKEVNGVELINAAEIKCEIGGTKIEILSYFLDTSDEELQALIDRIDELREERMKEMVEKVDAMIDENLALEDVEKHAEGALARPHLARTLLEKNVVDSVNEAFEEYIGDDCEGYVATKKLDAKDVIETVHENGGVTSLAHPGRNLKVEEADEKVEKLAELGLDGIETSYSYDALDRDHSIEIHFREKKAKELAEKHDLIKTGGSDSHGTQSEKDYIGEVKLEYLQVEKLKEKARL